MASPLSSAHDPAQQSPLLEDGEQALDSHVLSGSSHFCRSLDLLPRSPKSAIEDINNHWNGVQDFQRESLFRLEPKLRDPDAHSPSSEGWSKFRDHADEAREGQSPTDRNSIKLYKATQTFASPFESWKSPERGWPDRAWELKSRHENEYLDQNAINSDDTQSLLHDQQMSELSDVDKDPIGLSKPNEPSIGHDRPSSPALSTPGAGPSSSPGVAAVEICIDSQKGDIIEVDDVVDDFESVGIMMRDVFQSRERRQYASQSSARTRRKDLDNRVRKLKRSRR